MENTSLHIKFAPLAKRLPEHSFGLVMHVIEAYPVKLKITRTRSTKLGDFRNSTDGGLNTITVNHDLNPYAFLVTLIHELAHHTTWLQYGRKVQPHGTEWKMAFKALMQPFFEANVFPQALSLVLKKYLENAAASSCTDPNLYIALRQYDSAEKTANVLFLKDIRISEVFEFRGSHYTKLEVKRTRASIVSLKDGKKYNLAEIAEVKRVEN